MIAINKDIVGYTVNIPTPISIEELIEHLNNLQKAEVKTIDGCGTGTLSVGLNTESYMILKVGM